MLFRTTDSRSSETIPRKRTAIWSRLLPSVPVADSAVVAGSLHARGRRGALLAISLCLAALLTSQMTAGPARAIPIGGYNVVGSILVEYQRLANIGKSPGNPLANEQPDQQGGKFQKFVNNNYIYWNSRVDPGRGRQIGGAIYDKWGNYGWENGVLGYPIEPELNANQGGKFNKFEHGTIYWKSSTGAHPVMGQIYETWAANNYENGRFGFPVTDEENYGDGKRQKFENGEYIEWHPNGFDVDWAGDTYQDDDAGNNSDAFVPTCDDQCGGDATVKFNGGPLHNSSGAGSRSTEPAPSDTQPLDGSLFCDDLLNADPDEVSDRAFCIARPGTENELRRRAQEAQDLSAAELEYRAFCTERDP